jgi:hypothetical protein
MSLDLETLLQKSKQYETWLAISQNRITDALKMIPADPAVEKRSFFGLWKKKGATGAPLDPARQLAREVLTGRPTPAAGAPRTNLTEASEVFPEWICLLCALHHNGHYPQQTEALLEETLHWLQALVVEIREKANGYPSNPIAGHVWKNSSTIRSWCDPLVEIFTQQENRFGRASALQLKCRITGASMGHYPQTLGPDMIAAAAALEKIGDTAIPKGYYKAIISDFQPMADDHRTEPDYPVTQDDIRTLRALLEAYEGLNRLEGTDEFPDEQVFIMTILSKGVTAEPEEE